MYMLYAILWVFHQLHRTQCWICVGDPPAFPVNPKAVEFTYICPSSCTLLKLMEAMPEFVEQPLYLRESLRRSNIG